MLNEQQNDLISLRNCPLLVRWSSLKTHGLDLPMPLVGSGLRLSGFSLGGAKYPWMVCDLFFQLATMAKKTCHSK
jgi:hypothetical protein